MGDFVLGKPPVGKYEYSSGAKLPVGKLDNCLFGVHINAPTEHYGSSRCLPWKNV